MLRRTILLIMIAATDATPSPQCGPVGSAPEAMWQLPAHPPRALLFIAHGCQHGAIDFCFPRDAHSPRCLGLPEEVHMVSKAVQAGFAVLAISSADRETSRCWNPGIDGPIVRDAVPAFLAAHQLPSSLPVVALGASSGGAFVLQLPSYMPQIKAVVSQIMGVPPQWLPDRMPPTQFVHMTRDQRTASYVQKDVRKLKQSGVPTSTIEVHPQRPTADFFARKIARLSPQTAAQLHRALTPLLDKDGYLEDDPRRSEWRALLRATPGLVEELPGPDPAGPPDSLVPDASAVAECLNVAYAMHEIASDPMDETLRWIEGVLGLAGHWRHGAHAAGQGGPSAPNEPVELRRR